MVLVRQSDTPAVACSLTRPVTSVSSGSGLSGRCSSSPRPADDQGPPVAQPPATKPTPRRWHSAARSASRSAHVLRMASCSAGEVEHPGRAPARARARRAASARGRMTTSVRGGGSTSGRRSHSRVRLRARRSTSSANRGEPDSGSPTTSPSTSTSHGTAAPNRGRYESPRRKSPVSPEYPPQRPRVLCVLGGGNVSGDLQGNSEGAHRQSDLRRVALPTGHAS